MEYTGTHYKPIANMLYNASIFFQSLSIIDFYVTNRVRKIKTNQKDASKIANYTQSTISHRERLLQTLLFRDKKQIKENHQSGSPLFDMWNVDKKDFFLSHTQTPYFTTYIIDLQYKCNTK